MIKKSLYFTRIGRAILNSIVKKKPLTKVMGKFANTRASKLLIPRLKKSYKIDLTNFIVPKGGFKTLNEFFTREYKTEFMTFPSDLKVLAAPAEGYLSIQNNIKSEEVVQAKGCSYSLSELIGESAKKYDGGVLVKLRLTPKEYHHFLYLDNGKITGFKDIAGYYYTSDHCGLNKIKNLYSKSHRHVTKIKTKNFGEIIYVEIGATFVGTIVQNNVVGDVVRRGDKKGCFKFGGSTAVILFAKNKVKFSSEILKKMHTHQEVYVTLGQVVGKKV